MYEFLHGGQQRNYEIVELYYRDYLIDYHHLYAADCLYQPELY